LCLGLALVVVSAIAQSADQRQPFFPSGVDPSTSPTENEQIGGVSNGKQGGYKISDSKNAISLTTPENKVIQISEPFITGKTNWKPTETILCTWSPNGKWVAIFAPHPRITEIFLVDLQTETIIPRYFPSDTETGAGVNSNPWKNNTYSQRDTPGTWDGDQLSIYSSFMLNGGGTEVTEQILTINTPKKTGEVLNGTKEGGENNSDKAGETTFSVSPANNLRKRRGDTNPPASTSPPPNLKKPNPQKQRPQRVGGGWSWS
jgi:hypothetical protein